MSSDLWDRVDEANIKILVSPCHDKDPNGLGGLKKPHYHAVYMAPGKKTHESAKEIILTLFGRCVNTVFVCDDVGSTVRYFFHLDSPDKYPYPIKDYLEFGGAKVEDAIRLSSDVKKYDLEILDAINRLDIRYYDDLFEYASYVQTEWRDAVSHRTIHWTAFLKARNDKINKNVPSSLARQEINRAKKGN